MIRSGAFLALLAIFLALPAAAGHDADYYKRTGTKPPAAGDWYLGFRATGFNHAHGVGLATAGMWKNVGKYHVDVLWSGDLSAVEIAGQSGTAPLTLGCYVYQVPFQTKDRTVGQLGTSVMFKVGK